MIKPATIEFSLPLLPSEDREKDLRDVEDAFLSHVARIRAYWMLTALEEAWPDGVEVLGVLMGTENGDMVLDAVPVDGAGAMLPDAPEAEEIEELTALLSSYARNDAATVRCYRGLFGGKFGARQVTPLSRSVLAGLRHRLFTDEEHAAMARSGLEEGVPPSCAASKPRM